MVRILLSLQNEPIIMLKKPQKYYDELHFGEFYHIYNRAISSDLPFITENDMIFFLKRFNNYLLPLSDIYAYCLMPKHFHLMLRLKDVDEVTIETESISNSIFTQAFSNFFNSYSKTFNKIHRRRGRLFLYSFRRIIVKDDDYKRILISYIHRNPIHHHFRRDYESWRYSSYHSFLSKRKTRLRRKEVIELFGSENEFIAFHKSNIRKDGIEDYFLE